jgi:hypothetical protein
MSDKEFDKDIIEWKEQLGETMKLQQEKVNEH